MVIVEWSTAPEQMVAGERKVSATEDSEKIL